MDLDIDSVGHDEHGRCYDLDTDEPFDAITVNEADGTITLHGTPEIESVLRDLLALERDRLLGYPPGGLHMPVIDAVEDALATLEQREWDRDKLVLPEDQETLNL